MRLKHENEAPSQAAYLSRDATESASFAAIFKLAKTYGLFRSYYRRVVRSDFVPILSHE